MNRADRQLKKRIEGVLGGSQERAFAELVDRFFDHLQRALVLPSEVTGIEDLDWEEYYVCGPGDPREYARLRKNQPSYRDRYDLLAITRDGDSEWMLCPGEDIIAHVRRKTDAGEFDLGLSELKAIDRRSPNYRLLDDYAVFFANYR